MLFCQIFHFVSVTMIFQLVCVCDFSVVLQWMQSMTQWQIFTMTLICLVVSFGTPWCLTYQPRC